MSNVIRSYREARHLDRFAGVVDVQEMRGPQGYQAESHHEYHEAGDVRGEQKCQTMQETREHNLDEAGGNRHAAHQR